MASNRQTQWTRVSRAVLFLSFVAGSLACGSEPAPLPVPNLCGLITTVAEGRCGRWERCRGTTHLPDDCAVYYRVRANRDVAEPWRVGIASGRILYHPEALDSCREAFEAVSCAAPTEPLLPAACDALVEGLVPLGEPCESRWECEEGSCSHSRCTLLRPRDCALDCPAGATCEPSFTLFPYCEMHEEGVACGGDTTCGGDTVCVGATVTEMGRCEPVRVLYEIGEGETCTFQTGAPRCREGLHCAETGIDGAGDPIYSCEAGYASGGACYKATPEGCPDGEYCQRAPRHLDGRCVPLPREGQECASNTFRWARVCAEGLHCLGSSGTCVALLEDGAECARSGECASHVCSRQDDEPVGYCATRACE